MKLLIQLFILWFIISVIFSKFVTNVFWFPPFLINIFLIGGIPIIILFIVFKRAKK